MLKINQGQQSRHIHHQEMRIADFWEHCYLPYLEEVVTLTGKPRKKPSTVRGYKQIWNQHLKAHFANRTLREYEPFMGTQFLQTLTSTQSKVTIKHIKALILEYDNGPFRIHPANHDRSRSFGYARIHLGE